MILVTSIGSCRSSTESSVYGGTRELSPISVVRPETTKDKVLERLGEPKEKSADGRLLLYQYWKRGRDKVKWSTSSFELVSRKLHEVQLIIEFDKNDQVKRYKKHECKTNDDPACDQENALCEMLKKLEDENLLATYC